VDVFLGLKWRARVEHAGVGLVVHRVGSDLCPLYTNTINVHDYRRRRCEYIGPVHKVRRATLITSAVWLCVCLSVPVALMLTTRL
jgi:hypothetical protein